MSKSSQRSASKPNSIDLNSDIGNQLVVHKNISQEIIIINIDRLKLILQDHNAKIKRSTDWINPLAIFIALLLADLTATFNDFIGIKAPVWEAIFILLTLASGIYLLCSFVNIARKGSIIEGVIDKLKEHAQDSTDNQ